MPIKVAGKEFSKRFGELLKTARVNAGLSAPKVAEICGLKTPKTVYGWEAGTGGLTIDTIAFLCELYGTTVEEFFSIDKEDPYYTSDEIELINCYRALTDEGKELLRANARIYAGEQDIRDR